MISSNYNPIRLLGNITLGFIEGVSFISKSFEENLVTDFDFNNWTTDNNLGNWFESGGSVINKQSITTAPSSSNDFAVRFNTQDSFITQSFLVQNNSVYEIVAHASASDAGQGSIDLEISGYIMSKIQNLCGDGSKRMISIQVVQTSSNFKTFKIICRQIKTTLDSVFLEDGKFKLN